MHRLPLVLASVVLCVAPALARSQDTSADPVLVETATIKLYRSEYEAELKKLPPDIRPGFADNPRRVTDLLNRLVVQKALAAQARDRKLAESSEYSVRYRLEVDRALAQLRISDVEDQAAREFDAKLAQYEARARELYVADRKKYEVPEQVSASHILFDVRKHGKDEGLKLAQAARAKIVAGADFNTLAAEISEDPSAKQNGGRLGLFSRSGEMEPAFSAAAFALKQTGDVSEPVLSQFGWHLIKLDERRPAAPRKFEEVKDAIIAELRKKYVDEKREALLTSMRTDPTMKVDETAIDALMSPRVRREPPPKAGTPPSVK